MKKLNFDAKRVFTDAELDKMYRDMLIFDYVIIVNGCSPSFFPDFIAAQATGDFYLPCGRHDLGYFFGGNFKDKRAVDKRFLKDMKKVSSFKGVGDRALHYVKSYIYYPAVALFGDGAFNHWMRNGVARGHLPSYDINTKKPKSILAFESEHNVTFEVRHLPRFDKRVMRWVLTEEDFEKVKEIKFKLI